MIAVAVLGKRSRSWPGNVTRSVQCDGSVLPRSRVHYASLSHRIGIENDPASPCSGPHNPVQNRGWPRKPRAGRVNSRAVSTFVAALAQPPRRFHTSPGRCDACHAPAVTAPPAGVTGSRRPSVGCCRRLSGVSPGRPSGGRPELFQRLATCAAMPRRTGSRLATGLPCPHDLTGRARRRGRASWLPPA